VHEAEVIAAGGWSNCKTNILHYLQHVLALMLAPAQCLVHWMLHCKEHFLLDLSCLLEGEQMEVKQLIGKLYPMVCVPEFMGDKPKQWDFMVAVTTILLF
jgi:hypothetical protein